MPACTANYDRLYPCKKILPRAHGDNPPPGTHRSRFDYGVEALRSIVHAAAENTSTLATMTGDALISTP